MEMFTYIQCSVRKAFANNMGSVVKNFNFQGNGPSPLLILSLDVCFLLSSFFCIFIFLTFKEVTKS